MKRALRFSLALSLLLAIFSPITATAVSANPSPVCASSTCTITFTYTGDFYTWIAPYTGSYTLEVWGSQGGTAGYNGTAYSAGGLGGYAKGNINLTASSSVAIYVGGQGAGLAGTATAAPSAGGWNGGGAGYLGTSTSDNRGAGGGGGSDIRVGGTALSNRVIVAGGGAGGAKFSGYGTNYPGAGGGSSGGDGGTANYSSAYTYNGKGGSQTAGGVRGMNCSTGATDGSLGQGGQSDVMDSMGGAGGGGGYWGGGGSGCGMAGGGGSGYVGGVTTTTLTSGANVMANPAGGTMTGNTGNGVARITYLSGPTITKFAPRLAFTNSTSITYDLTFSETVTGLIAGDFSISGTGSSTCSIGSPGGSGNIYTVGLTGCSVGTVILTIGANTVTNSGAQTGPTSNTPAATVLIDQTAPTIASVTAPSNATYIPTNTPTFTVNFSESVTVTGTPRLALTVGTTNKYATFLAFTDSKTATFRYTVTTDPLEFDTDGIAVSTTLDLNGGSIADLATNALSPLTFTAPTLTSVLVAQKPGAPTIDSVTATSGTLTTYFTAGASNGAAISSYEYSTDNGSTWKARASGTTASPIVITTVSASATSLTNGTTYSLRIRAVNAAGSGDSSTAVSAMPSAVVVSGDATLTLTYGSTASTSTYTAIGGTGSYTYTLSSTPSGVSISAGVVTASGTTSAGTYTQNVQATDGNSQVGLKQLVITVNKATTSITIALPNNSSNAALGGAVTITATVPRAGQVNFKLGGTTISGCGTAAAASTTATCSWTPGSLGGVSITAVFTPTDSSNFETSTSTTLSITVVNGTSSVTLSLTGGVTQASKGNTINIIAAVDQAGKLTILVDGKRLVGCFNISVSAGNKSCAWKPAVQKQVSITATLNPTNSVYNNSSAQLIALVVRRTGTR